MRRLLSGGTYREGAGFGIGIGIERRLSSPRIAALHVIEISKVMPAGQCG
jgi:hypothetical protein